MNDFWIVVALAVVVGWLVAEWRKRRQRRKNFDRDEIGW